MLHVCVVSHIHMWTRNWIYIKYKYMESFLMSYVYLHIIYGLQYLKRLLLAMLCCRIHIHLLRIDECVLFLTSLSSSFFLSIAMYVIHEMCFFSRSFCLFHSFWLANIWKCVPLFLISCSLSFFDGGDDAINTKNGCVFIIKIRIFIWFIVHTKSWIITESTKFSRIIFESTFFPY